MNTETISADPIEKLDNIIKQDIREGMKHAFRNLPSFTSDDSKNDSREEGLIQAGDFTFTPDEIKNQDLIIAKMDSMMKETAKTYGVPVEVLGCLLLRDFYNMCESDQKDTILRNYILAFEHGHPENVDVETLFRSVKPGDLCRFV